MTIEAASALAGIRVLELADESGVYCGKLLADLGGAIRLARSRRSQATCPARTGASSFST